MKPRIVQEDGHTNPNLWGGPLGDRPPTASPPVDFLIGAVDMRIFNNGSQPVQANPCLDTCVSMESGCSVG
jgi:hypothetical protein